MKLYLKNCPNCGHRNYLGIQASTKNELRVHFRGGDSFYATCGNCGHQAIYYIHDIKAYSDSNVTPGGAIAGGLIGLLGGPIGLIIGGVAGGLLGTANDNEDQRKANVFNASR